MVRENLGLRKELVEVSGGAWGGQLGIELGDVFISSDEASFTCYGRPVRPSRGGWAGSLPCALGFWPSSLHTGDPCCSLETPLLMPRGPS